MPVTLVKKVGANDIKLAPTWRKRWDSNPRAREDYLISSQARYDHFDTAPYMLNRCFSSPFSDRKGLWKELTERTANYSVFRTG